MLQVCSSGETKQAHTHGRTDDTHSHMTDPEDPGEPLERYLEAK